MPGGAAHKCHNVMCKISVFIHPCSPVLRSKGNKSIRSLECFCGNDPADSIRNLNQALRLGLMPTHAQEKWEVAIMVCFVWGSEALGLETVLKHRMVEEAYAPYRLSTTHQVGTPGVSSPAHQLWRLLNKRTALVRRPRVWRRTTCSLPMTTHLWLRKTAQSAPG